MIRKSDFEKAGKNLEKALEIAREMNMEPKIIWLLSQKINFLDTVAKNYARQGKFIEALKYLKEAQKIIDEHKLNDKFSFIKVIETLERELNEGKN